MAAVPPGTCPAWERAAGTDVALSTDAQAPLIKVNQGNSVDAL